ncbi:transposase [Streptomyces inhibens]|uniref:transposase n=1 Tax=Streptomyces inhibens TaxID=2293571 RepID=UPI00402A60BB
MPETWPARACSVGVCGCRLWVSVGVCGCLWVVDEGGVVRRGELTDVVWQAISPLLTAPGTRKAGSVRPVDGEALGRSRGGRSTKIYLACDGRGMPLSILVTPGQAGDSPMLLPVLDAITVKGRIGRPRKQPDVLIADKGYAQDSTRPRLHPHPASPARHPVRHSRTLRPDRPPRRQRLPRAAGHPAFDPDLYEQLNVVERCFNRLTRSRGSGAWVTMPARAIWAAVRLAAECVTPIAEAMSRTKSGPSAGARRSAGAESGPASPAC